MGEWGLLQELETLLGELRTGRISPVAFQEALLLRSSALEALQQDLEQIEIPEELEEFLRPEVDRGQAALVCLRDGLARLADPGDSGLEAGLELTGRGIVAVEESWGRLRATREDLERRGFQSGLP